MRRGRGWAYLAGCGLRVGLRLVPDVAALAGAGLVAYGGWLVFRPAGFIAGGVLLIAGAWLFERQQG